MEQLAAAMVTFSCLAESADQFKKVRAYGMEVYSDEGNWRFYQYLLHYQKTLFFSNELLIQQEVENCTKQQGLMDKEDYRI